MDTTDTTGTTGTVGTTDTTGTRDTADTYHSHHRHHRHHRYHAPDTTGITDTMLIADSAHFVMSYQPKEDLQVIKTALLDVPHT